MKSSIILTGFMGTGKTAIGKRLASLLEMDFYDTDQEIESVTGMTILQLFNRYGEVRFRSEENLAVRRLVQKNDCIIATGGGVILDQENIDLLAEKGMIICLSARPEIICERVKKRNNRPLLKNGDPYETVVKLLKEREDLYKCADLYIDTSELTFSESIKKIVVFLEKCWQKPIDVQKFENWC